MNPRAESPLIARPFRIDGARGCAYADLPPGTKERMASWLRAGSVPEGEEIKPGRVYGLDGWIVKLFGFGGALKDRVRVSPAVRSARRHARLQDIGTPRPVATLERPGGRDSLLVMERIDGLFLPEVIARKLTPALDAFVVFMAETHRRRLLHGDLHIYQMLWNGERWFLLDLDGLRHLLRTLRRRHLIEGHWTRLYFSLERDAEIERLFWRYVDVARPSWDPAAAWKRIVAGERSMCAERE